MAANSKIEWTHHTFNPWSGCTKVSHGCANCYAANAMPSARRFAVWGDGEERKPASEAYWRQPLKWDRDAAEAGERRRVFCASMADVFEDRADLYDRRVRLFNLICSTPNLDWLLLTKRPENMVRWWRAQQDEAKRAGAEAWWPGNAWAGTSVENQQAADERIPWLLQMPARVRFLSMEPLPGFVNICAGLFTQPPAGESDESPEAGGMWRGPSPLGAAGLSWVIAGGESGHRARPMSLSWVRGIRDQCRSAGVPFFFKQWGEWAPDWYRDDDAPPGTPWQQAEESMSRVGKRDAGRLLDGRTWDEVPHV